MFVAGKMCNAKKHHTELSSFTKPSWLMLGISINEATNHGLSVWGLPGTLDARKIGVLRSAGYP